MDISQARRNGELISISSNQVIQSVLRLKNREFSQEKLNDLFIERKKLRSIPNSQENINHLLDIENKINDILFVPEIVSITLDKKNHYDKIIQKGFSINDKEYVRLLCGAGHSRRNTVIFCQKEIEQPLKEVLNNGRKISEMVLAKNNAYFALAYSGTMPVSEPYFCVIKDYEVKRTETVEFIYDSGEIKIEDKELDFNIFDGQGLISPRLAKQWAVEIGIEDYIPSAFIIRNSFLKGMVCVADFHKFSDECGIHLINDAWGNQVNIRDMDLIITTSQFKGWNQYDSCQDYIYNCRKNNFSFGISRVSPKEDHTHVFSNYQFLQVLDIPDNKIPSLCKKTIDYFNNIINVDINHTLLYLLGGLTQKEFDKDIYSKISDPVTKALILNNKLIDDPYIKNHIIHSLNKKIKESYIGNLIFDGNYSFIAQDPYAFMEHIFGLPVKGLLGRDQFYSNFWNERKVNKIVAMRAPLTWKSEPKVMNLMNTAELREWYQYLDVGVTILNSNDATNVRISDCDEDGDLIFTTNQQEFIEGVYGGYPITYEKKKAPKREVIENELWNIDKLSFESRIGYITNCSTTLYSMLPTIDEKDKNDEIIRRLKYCRKAQGDQIDSAKGVEVLQFPKHWTNWTKITEDMTEENKAEAEFNNSILIDKRPYFFRYLYTNYNQDLINFNMVYNNYSETHFGKSYIDVSGSSISDEEHLLIHKYNRFVPLLDSNCIMNKICHYLEKEIKEIKADAKVNQSSDIINILRDLSIPFDEVKFKSLFNIYKKYKSEKRKFMNIRDASGEEVFKTLEQYSKHIRQEALKISSNMSELANLAVTICYELNDHDSKTFVWNVFSEGLIQNIEKNKQSNCFIPHLDQNGNIEHLGQRYSLVEIKPLGDEFLYDYNF